MKSWFHAAWPPFTTKHRPPSRQVLALIMWLKHKGKWAKMSLLFYAGACCFLSLHVRAGLNQVVQVSSRFETCRNVKMHSGRSVWGNRPVKAHVSCQDPSVEGEHVCDSVCHQYFPFSTWSNEAWSSSVVSVSSGRSSVPVSLFSSHHHNGYIWAAISFLLPHLTSDVGLSALAWWEVFRSISHLVGVTPGWN